MIVNNMNSINHIYYLVTIHKDNDIFGIYCLLNVQLICHADTMDIFVEFMTEVFINCR